MMVSFFLWSCICHKYICWKFTLSKLAQLMISKLFLREIVLLYWLHTFWQYPILNFKQVSEKICYYLQLIRIHYWPCIPFWITYHQQNFFFLSTFLSNLPTALREYWLYFCLNQHNLHVKRKSTELQYALKTFLYYAYCILRGRRPLYVSTWYNSMWSSLSSTWYNSMW